MTRNRVRLAALLAFLVAILGPWGDRTDFPGLVELMLDEPLDWVSLHIAGCVAVPLACLMAGLAPASRIRSTIYRLLLIWTLVPMTAFLVLGRPSLRQLGAAWGLFLYLAALLVALVGELIPVRSRAKADYKDVFR